MDIVRIFEEYCNTNEFKFVYGTKAVQNLIQIGFQDCDKKIHILLDPVRRKSDISSQGFSQGSNTYSGRYMLVMPDDFTVDYETKYSTHIEPLLTTFKALEKQFVACDGYDLTQHENVDVTDALDANLTGLVCTFQMKVYE